MAASDTQIRARDLRVGDPALRARLIGVFERVLDHGMFIGGPELETFERQFADFCGVRHAVGCASGTSALYLALRGLGLGPGDEVITTPLSWIATLNAINAVGATAAFADIGPDLNIDPTTIEAKITTRTRVILPVHFTGRMCDMDAITEIAQRNNLLVIEDAAQSAGARYRGRPAGSFSDAAAFSFNPMKVFGALGEAGMVTTPDTAVRDRIESFRYLGTVNRETCVARELNHKMDA
ncbi:MAG: aminotransferase class V-fold PLP-dependent enzyme, partial [Rhodospirillales bacterium]